MSYAAAMAAESARLEAFRKRNAEEARGVGEEELETAESAWDSVFAKGQAVAQNAEGEARERKRQRKAEKRKEKAAHEAANAGNLTIYVSGIPKEIGFTAVQALFGRVGEVRRVKLYKDEKGEQKGDGLVTFAREEAVQQALEREWNLHGDPLRVEAAKFDAHNAGVPKEDWDRVVVLLHMFATEEVASSGDPASFMKALEEETWVECLRFGAVERVRACAADPQCPVAIRFVEVAAAAACVKAMDGRWFNERSIDASTFDGNRKRAPEADNDDDRIARLKRPPTPPPPPPPTQTEAASAAAASSDAAAGASGAAGGEAEAAAPLTLPSGNYVKLRGLVGAAEHNGKVGVIKSYDSAVGRYTIELSDRTLLALKRQNLLQMLAVTLAGLEGPESAHNGAKGTIFDYDETSGMYGVELDQPAGEAVPVPVNGAVLPDGAVGIVRGLQAAPQYNGMLAKVLAHDADAGRYNAALDDGKQLRLKRQNLLVSG